jgi:cytohesin
LELLKKNGYSKEIDYDGKGESLLLTIIQNGSLDILNEVIGTIYSVEHECHVDKKDTPLMVACCEVSIVRVNLLIIKGADINAKDVYGKTALIYASGNGNVLTAFVLVKHGADVNAVCDDSFTALLYACQYKYYYIVKILVLGGADVNAVNDFGDTHLRWALYNNEIKTAKLLFSHGARVPIH